MPDRSIALLCLRFLLFTATFAFSTNLAQAQPTYRDLSRPGDYDTNNRQGWNGLGTLGALAEGSGLKVVQRQTINWEELDSDDIVLLLYPTSSLDAGHLITFVRNGGRILLADDYGSSKGLITELGARRSLSIEADKYHEDQVFAPIAHPVTKHPLTEGVAELTTNHPGALTGLDSSLESVFEFSKGHTLVAAGRIGAGRFVLLTDPSILINRMLQFEGNFAFSINLLRYLARKDSTDRLVILNGNIRFRGVPRNQFSDGTLRGNASASVATLDHWLDEPNLWFFTARGLRIITLIVALALGLLMFMTLPSMRQRALDGTWTRPGAERLHDTRQAFPTSKKHNFLLAAAITRDNVNTALSDSLQSEVPLDALSESQLLATTHRMLGLNLSRALKSLLPKLRTIPSQAQAAAQWEPRFLSYSEFEALHKSASSFIDLLQDVNET